MVLLEVRDLHVNVDDKGEEKEILKGISIKLESGKVYALMGPNGSGKTSLSNVLVGHPKYKITSGKILLKKKDITNLNPEQKAKKGIFVCFQFPREVSGVSLSDFLRAAYNSLHPNKRKSILEFYELLKEKAKLLDINETFLERYLNEGFSGGEKKKSEILQMLVLNPKFAILDEVDSGLDIDSLRRVAKSVNNFITKDKCVLIITHYKKILQYIKPNKVFVMIDGKINLKKGKNFANHIEKKGYAWIKDEKHSSSNN